MAKKKKKAAGKGGSKALTNVPPRALAPRQKASFGGRGFESLEREDILIPRVKLLQANSPEVEGELAQKKGTIFTIPANRNFGDKVLITPIMHFRSRIHWEGDRDDADATITCQSDDGLVPRRNVHNVKSGLCADCTMKDWNEGKEGKDAIPCCTLYENFVVLLGNEKEPVILPMERTKVKAARKFFSMGAMKGVDFWNFQYELKVIKEKNAAEKHYYTYAVSDVNKQTSAEVRKNCEQRFLGLAKKTIQAAELQPERAEAGASGGDSRDL